MNVKRYAKVSGAALAGVGVIGLTTGTASAHAVSIQGPAAVGSAGVTSSHVTAVVCNYYSSWTNRGEYKLVSNDVLEFTNHTMSNNCAFFALPIAAKAVRNCDPAGCSAWIAT